MQIERLEENQRIKEFDEGLLTNVNGSAAGASKCLGELCNDGQQWGTYSRQLDSKVCSGVFATMDTLTVFFEIQ